MSDTIKCLVCDQKKSAMRKFYLQIYEPLCASLGEFFWICNTCKKTLLPEERTGVQAALRGHAISGIQEQLQGILVRKAD